MSRLALLAVTALALAACVQNDRPRSSYYRDGYYGGSGYSDGYRYRDGYRSKDRYRSGYYDRDRGDRYWRRVQEQQQLNPPGP
ncbi:hypothetical protein [Reyranella sp. CPCC 100927]|uniref:hypothetical protein n=1 Tax=Reyranella sp. CPCC 100927 TaxID=2599616 RepID=UPI0011B7F7AD|nr:hypothetical protein [Reyranella sp. CPCC 100927]TWT13891.1 hypothetical protein FQU96_08255 [Reyranella sp. CPCC 100927]